MMDLFWVLWLSVGIILFLTGPEFAALIGAKGQEYDVDRDEIHELLVRLGGGVEARVALCLLLALLTLCWPIVFLPDRGHEDEHR